MSPVGRKTEGVAYWVSAFEGATEHAPVCCEDTHVLVQERGKILAGLILVHCDAGPGMEMLEQTRLVVRVRTTSTVRDPESMRWAVIRIPCCFRWANELSAVGHDDVTVSSRSSALGHREFHLNSYHHSFSRRIISLLRS